MRFALPSRMRARWLSLALVSALLGGCFATHGTGRDAGATVDAEVMCELFDASVTSLVCPRVVGAGSIATVFVTSTPRACCSSGTVRTSVASTGTSHTVTLAWDACDCCEECDCRAPLEEVSVALGLLPVGLHRVDAHGQSCSFEVVAPLPPGERCDPPFAGTDFRAPAHLFEGQPYPVTLTSEPASGCSCSPRVAGDATSFALELCDCCDECECVDSGYQASAVRDPLPLGAHAIVFPHGAGSVTVHDRAACRSIEATAVTIVPPRRDLILGGPALTWARVEGEDWVCCATPQAVVEQADTTGPGGIALMLSSCVYEDCDCVPGAPTATSAWFSLGELAPGAYSVRVGDIATTFTVD